MQLSVAILLASLIAYLAFRVRSLDRSGAYAAFLIGTMIFGLGGWRWAFLLLAFFISSSALSRAFDAHKREASEKYAKGNQRDAGQVMGNGAIPALFAGLHVLYPGETWPWLGFAAALAAVNADTWATELGVLNRTSPRLITNLRVLVEKGTSGGVSMLGTLASLAGAMVIGFLAELLFSIGITWLIFLPVTVAGFLGALFDSFLGATVQGIYYCPSCKKETERHPTHDCGTQTTRIRGWIWLNNDWVNFACGAFGVGIIFTFWFVRLILNVT
ncbi:MAG: DUF92 domain-containing protein [Anaerolineae bacterium]|nr:DUF92 domain-containing protein [Anaerolineae bacterium]MDK1081019.1 DUF92 domain-containing protein [Anaerolineae bacterium]